MFYTIDGTLPNNSSSVYVAPIDVATTTVIRTYSASFSYIFPERVPAQPFERDHFPRWRDELGNGPVMSKLGPLCFRNLSMDVAIVNSPEGLDLVKGLWSLPSISLVADPVGIFDRTHGFYFSVTDKTQDDASCEFLFPSQPTQNRQRLCTLSGHSGLLTKRSIDLRLDRPMSIFAASQGVRRISSESLLLRAGHNRAFTALVNTSYTEDVFHRSLQMQASGVGLHSTPVHLYINGIYYGMYEVRN
jgi:hypothetical protein